MVTTRAQSRAESSPPPPPLRISLDSPFKLRYFQEGAAYVLYDIGRLITGLPFEDKDFGSSSGSEGQPPVDPQLRGKLLKLRKQTPSAAPVIESQEHFKAKVLPLVPKGMLVEQKLCEVSRDVLNSTIRTCGETRDSKSFAMTDELEPILQKTNLMACW